MARSEARLHCRAWCDPDFLGLSAQAQRCYMLLLSQSDLTLAGVIAYRPSRWARFAPNTTAESIEKAVAELASARFVVVDEDAGELFVRTFVKNDRAYRSPKLAKAMWQAADMIVSETIREAFEESLPDDVPPRGASAATGRPRTPRDTPSDTPSDTPPGGVADTAGGQGVGGGSGSTSVGNKSREAFESDFDAVWELYPRKVSRKAALRAYIARRRAGVPAEDLAAAVANYAAEMDGREDRFVKHGATFFGPDEHFADWVAGAPESNGSEPDASALSRTATW